MKLGMNMLLWSADVTGPECGATFEMLKDAGFDGVEIPIFDREVDKYSRKRVRARRGNARAAAHVRPGPARPPSGRPSRAS